MPITGRSTGRSLAASVQASASSVWLATCARLSPVTSAPQPFSCAIRVGDAASSYRRMMMVKMSSGQLSRIASWISVKGTTRQPHPARVLGHHFAAGCITFSSARSLV